jgi:ABC-type transport system involved in cytochrome c biogenesis permease subunit
MIEFVNIIQRNFLFLSVVLYVIAFIFFLLRKYTLELIFVVLAFVVHSIYLGFSGYFGGIYLFLKVAESPAFLPWVMAVIFILNNLKANDHQVWGYNIVIIIAFAFIAYLTPPSTAYFGPNKQSIWTILFFVTNCFAQGFFFFGAMMAILFLLKKTDSDKFHLLLIWGFVFHTLVHVTGGIWCFLGWATIFHWVYVHFQSAAEWIYYANYLHLRFLPSWNDKHRAIYAIAGSLIILVFKFI